MYFTNPVIRNSGVEVKCCVQHLVQAPLWRRFGFQVRAGWNDGCQLHGHYFRSRKHHLMIKDINRRNFIVNF